MVRKIENSSWIHKGGEDRKQTSGPRQERQTGEYRELLAYQSTEGEITQETSLRRLP